jgi:hypothetical protein
MPLSSSYIRPQPIGTPDTRRPARRCTTCSTGIIAREPVQVLAVQSHRAPSLPYAGKAPPVCPLAASGTSRSGKEQAYDSRDKQNACHPRLDGGGYWGLRRPEVSWFPGATVCVTEGWRRCFSARCAPVPDRYGPAPRPRRRSGSGRPGRPQWRRHEPGRPAWRRPPVCADPRAPGHWCPGL